MQRGPSMALQYVRPSCPIGTHSSSAVDICGILLKQFHGLRAYRIEQATVLQSTRSQVPLAMVSVGCKAHRLKTSSGLVNLWGDFTPKWGASTYADPSSFEFGQRRASQHGEELDSMS